MKIIFMGTPEFAVPTLEALIEKHEVLAVATQPDRPKGRGNKLSPPPVKEVAIRHNIPVLQPNRARDDSFIEEIEKFCPDAVVVVAFGQILPEKILNLPRYGCINVHGSLLPKYRGASPIQQAIIDGETITGVTIMHMDKGLDTGDMILKQEIIITKQDTAGTLHDKMAPVGAAALIEALARLENGTAERVKQVDSESSYAKMLKKETGHINFANDSAKIFNLVRGLNPWPSAYAYYKGGLLKIWEVEVIDNKENVQPGQIVSADDDGILVKTGDGAILIKQLQAQGGKRMHVEAYLRGNKINVGEILE